MWAVLNKITNGFYQHKKILKCRTHFKTSQKRSIINYIFVWQNTNMKIQDVRVISKSKLWSLPFFVKSIIIKIITIIRSFRWRHIYCVFEYIYSLRIDKELYESRKVSIKFMCTLLGYLCLSSGKLFFFRVFPLYSYFWC